MDKLTARKVAKDNVLALSAEQKQEYSGKIISSFTPFLDGAATVFVYVANENEVDTKPLIASLTAKKMKVFTPKINGDKMLLVPTAKDSTYAVGAYGISEVEGEGIEFFDADINVIPVVAYDKERNRVGHGKGCYDKYLSRATGKTYALAFSAQEVDNVDAEKYDIKPRFIITEKGFVK